jgi:predicted enzyme related to lactoylglutathione lyase
MAMGTPRLMSVELHTDDVAGLARFYVDVVGLDLAPGDDEATHYETSWGEWGGNDFCFFAIQPITHGPPTTGLEFGFEVDSLAVAHEKAVAAGAEVVEAPTPRPWGAHAVYRDPAGNLVELNER